MRTAYFAIFGVVAIVLIAGLVLMLSAEKTGEGIYIAFDTAREACLRSIMCNDGGGAILVSEAYENPARCVCPEHFNPGTILDWTALRRGEVAPPALSWYEGAENRIRWT